MKKTEYTTQEFLNELSKAGIKITKQRLQQLRDGVNVTKTYISKKTGEPKKHTYFVEAKLTPGTHFNWIKGNIFYKHSALNIIKKGSQKIAK